MTDKIIHPKVGLPYPAQNVDADNAEKYLAWWNAMKDWVIALDPSATVTRTNIADKMATIQMEIK